MIQMYTFITETINIQKKIVKRYGNYERKKS